MLHSSAKRSPDEFTCFWGNLLVAVLGQGSADVCDVGCCTAKPIGESGSRSWDGVGADPRSLMSSISVHGCP